MPDVGLVASLGILAAVLVAVTRSPGGRSEVTWTAPAAALVVATGLVGWRQARHVVADLAPTLAFLAAMFVLAHLAEQAGVFRRAAAVLGRAARPGRSPMALLVAVAALAVAVTSTLSLDATAVLLTPVVVAVVAHRPDRDRSLLLTTFLANGASLLFPVANLTNLLALDQLDLTFGAFAARMALPTLVAAVVLTVGCRFVIPGVAAHAHAGTDPAEARPMPTPTPTPTPRPDGPAADRADDRDAWWVVGGIVVLLVAFAVASTRGIRPAPVAVVGTAVLLVVGLARRTVAARSALAAVDLRFLAFVATLGVAVAAPAERGLTRFVADRLPSGTGLGALLLVAAVAAVLANVVTNLPATLVLLPALATRTPTVALAALIGLNAGPMVTPTASLATLLWRRVVRAAGVEPPLARHLVAAAILTPPTVVGAVVALWAVGGR